MLGVPVRRVEAAAWLGSGLLCGVAGLLLSNLVGLDVGSVVPGHPGAGHGADRPAPVAVGHLAAGFVIGIVQSSLTAFSNLADYRTLTPFVLAIIALLSFAPARARCWWRWPR